MGQNLFILNECCAVVPCADETAWATWMDEPKNLLILQTKGRAGKSVSTRFLGFNGATTDKPVFFDTYIHAISDSLAAMRNTVGMIYAVSATWQQAMDHHARGVAYMQRMVV